MSWKNTIVIDNYDSFTYNLVQIIEEIIGVTPDVKRNDEITGEECLSYDYIILSPGPGLPNESGNLIEIIETCKKTKKIFGVCLGLQAIGEVFGSELLNLGRVFHGIQTKVMKSDVEHIILKEIPDEFDAGRYHSWVINKEAVSDELIITSKDANDEIMSARHNSLSIYGVQFHPESILTPLGKQMILNFYKHG